MLRPLGLAPEASIAIENPRETFQEFLTSKGLRVTSQRLAIFDASFNQPDHFTAEDGLEPHELAGDLPASVNLWGFQPAIWGVLEVAMGSSGIDEEVLLAQVAGGGEVTKSEVLLPEVVATMVAAGSGLPVRVVTTEARLWVSPMRPTSRWSVPSSPARSPGGPGRASCGDADGCVGTPPCHHPKRIPARVGSRTTKMCGPPLVTRMTIRGSVTTCST